MEWSSEWPKENPKDLARYVVPEWSEQVANFQFDFNHNDALQSKEGRRKIVKSIYDKLRERSPSIHYAREDYAPEENIQIIRRPDEILQPPKPRGTCLDLSLLFCGLCLSNDLLPTLIVLQGHALVAVSLNFVLRNDGPTSWKAYSQERLYFENALGMLKYETDNDTAFLQEVIAKGDCIPVECTGFAHSETLDEAMPEGKGRIGGFLSFERALEAGKEQLVQNKRQFQYALDICYLHYKASIKPYEKGAEIMVIEIAELASKIVGVILVPFLKQGTEKFAKQIGEEAGEASASLALKVWEKVKAVFDSGKDKERIEKFEEKPEELKTRMTGFLEERLEENSQLAQEFDELIRKTETSDGKNVVQIIADKVGYVDARHAVISGNSIVAGYVGNVGAVRSHSQHPKSPPLSTLDEDE